MIRKFRKIFTRRDSNCVEWALIVGLILVAAIAAYPLVRPPKNP